MRRPELSLCCEGEVFSAQRAFYSDDAEQREEREEGADLGEEELALRWGSAENRKILLR